MKYARTNKLDGRQRRARRVRKRVSGTATKPRMSVYRSLNNMYVQLIDDERGVSVIGFSSTNTEFKKEKKEPGKIATAKAVGVKIAELAKDKGITKVVFDRNGYLYHGRIKALAEGAREGGLNF